MGKVKLTKTQAEEIERIKKVGHPVKWKEDGWYINRAEKINELSFREYLDAINEGYEVEPDFKADDFVAFKFDGAISVIGKIVEIIGDDMARVDDPNYPVPQCIHVSNLRQSTQSEFETEMTRRWWTKHDRDVWEIRVGDVLRYKSGLRAIRTVTKINSIDEYVTDENYTPFTKEELVDSFEVVCFAEDRKDV